MKEKNSPIMVTVRCVVYNHEPYLRQCLDGFVMQNTNFPFEAIVHDDASTDSSAAIIQEYARKYPNIIKPIIETENQYSKKDGSLRRILNEHTHGKYIALCEGDDYWTDPNKLQVQFDFMESHPDYSLCFHAVNRVRDNIIIDNNKHFNKEVSVSTERLISKGGAFCPTLSLFMKREMIMEYPEFRRLAKVGDYPVVCLAGYRGKVYYFPQIMGCYRVMSAGSWSANNCQKFNAEHHINRMSWLKEFDNFSDHRYTSAVYFSILDSALALYSHGEISKKEVKDVFHRINITKLDVNIKDKWIFLKQYFSILLEN